MLHMAYKYFTIVRSVMLYDVEDPIFASLVDSAQIFPSLESPMSTDGIIRLVLTCCPSILNEMCSSTVLNLSRTWTDSPKPLHCSPHCKRLNCSNRHLSYCIVTLLMVFNKLVTSSMRMACRKSCC